MSYKIEKRKVVQDILGVQAIVVGSIEVQLHFKHETIW